MDNPIRSNKPTTKNITQASVGSESSSATQEQKKASQGISQAKDSFEEVKTKPSLFYEAREDIQDMNEDKKYYLNKLQAGNKAADRLSDELSRLVDVSTDLSSKENNNDATPTIRKKKSLKMQPSND